MMSHSSARNYLLLLTSVALLSGCGLSKNSVLLKLSSLVGGGPSGPGEGMIIPAPPSSESVVSVAHFKQTYPSMLALTGQTAIPACDDVYSQVQGNLAKVGAVNEISATQMGATMSLSACVCDGLIKKEKLLSGPSRIFFSDINFTAGAMNSSTVLLDRSFQRLVETFTAAPADANDRSDASALLSTMALTGSLTVARTEKALLALCAGTLASAAAQMQ